MREVHGFKVRGLTRKEIGELAAYGFYHSFYQPPMHDPKACDNGLFLVLSTCVEDFPETADDMPNKTLSALFKGVMRETYGAEEEEKN